MPRSIETLPTNDITKTTCMIGDREFLEIIIEDTSKRQTNSKGAVSYDEAKLVRTYVQRETNPA